MFRLGFSLSHWEVLCYKQAAVMTHSLDDQIRSLQGSCTQFIATYVDHNTAAIFDQGTFHRMDNICKLCYWWN